MIVIYALLGLLVFTDTGLTLWALKHGYREINPRMVRVVKSPAVAVIVDILRIAVAVWAISAAMGYSAVWGWASAGAFLALAAYPVIHNLKVLKWL